MNAPFNFKQFSVAQNKCAMKVGTDGVLLGAWASLSHKPTNILDIGAGTGVIALMLAQRTAELGIADEIDGLEINPDAYEQCVFNFENSPWNNRLFCYHASLNEFTAEADQVYDLIISNPPFYSEAYQTDNIARNQARFKNSLPTPELVQSASALLSENGTLAVVVPFKTETEFISLAKEHYLFPNRLCRIKGTANTAVKRSLIELSKTKTPCKETNLIIELNRHEYTADYTALVKDFYLKM